jgi:hypothetical protein
MTKPNILKSRKFWLMIADVVVSTATYFITNRIDPALAKDILWLIGSWQPVIIFLIGSIAYEDGKAMDNAYVMDLDADPVTEL